MSATANSLPPHDAPDSPPRLLASLGMDGWFALDAAGCPSTSAPGANGHDRAGSAPAEPPLVPHVRLWEQPHLLWLHPDACALQQAMEQGEAVKGALCQTRAAPQDGSSGRAQVWVVHVEARADVPPRTPDTGSRCATWLDITVAAQALALTQAPPAAVHDAPRTAPLTDADTTTAALAPLRPATGVWTDPHRFQSAMEMETAASAQIGRGCALLVFRWLGSPNAAGLAGMPLAVHAVESHLAAARRPSDTLARTGVQEWAMLLTMLGSDAMVIAHDMHRMALRVIESVSLDLAQRTGLEAGLALADSGHLVVGITLIESHSEAAATALAQAQACMPSLEAPGALHGVAFANAAIQERIHTHNTLTAELSRAIELGELRLYYQPVVDIHADTVGAEALIRWANTTHGLIAPSRFIPLAEDSGLIIPIGRWILRTACQQLVDWARIPYKAAWTIAVNISAQQFQRPDFASDVLAVVLETGANPRRLKLELTESLMMQDVEGAIATMKTLQTHGIKFSLDDFGTGYSSLSYLKRIPLDQVKIDQSFVRDLHTDANDAAIVKTILALAHSLELAVVAEGVETLEQEEFLVAAGCRYMQGYLYGRPAPIADWH
jgi:EAL domain-containing protein (putative c-di-GMP-specific phosphodiesterase class I)